MYRYKFLSSFFCYLTALFLTWSIKLCVGVYSVQEAKLLTLYEAV